MERRIAVFRQSKGQERCQQGYGFYDGEPVLAQRVFEFPYLLVGSLMGFKLPYPLEQVDHRVERTILIVLCTAALPTNMRLLGDMVFEHLYQAALANAGLTRE